MCNCWWVHRHKKFSSLHFISFLRKSFIFKLLLFRVYYYLI
nr:MAG TPA: hypothetical protein [Caudoviricetes sp.]